MNFSEFEQLLEIGDAGAKPFPWEFNYQHGEKGDETYLFRIESPKFEYKLAYKNFAEILKRELIEDIIISGLELKTDKIFDISFKVEYGMWDDSTNAGELFPLMATIMEVTQHVIKKYKPNVICFSGIKQKGDNKRNKLYLAYAEKQLKKFPGKNKIEMSKDAVVISLNKNYEKSLGKIVKVLGEFYEQFY